MISLTGQIFQPQHHPDTEGTSGETNISSSDRSWKHIHRLRSSDERLK